MRMTAFIQPTHNLNKWRKPMSTKAKTELWRKQNRSKNMSRKSFRYEKTSTTGTWSQGTCRHRICTQTWVLSTLQCPWRPSIVNLSEQELKKTQKYRVWETPRKIWEKQNTRTEFRIENLKSFSASDSGKFRSVVGLRFYRRNSNFNEVTRVNLFNFFAIAKKRSFSHEHLCLCHESDCGSECFCMQ